MRLAPFLLVAMTMSGVPARAATSLPDTAGNYSLSPNASVLGFSIASVGGHGLSGRFNEFTGTIDINPHDVGRSSVTITITPASVWTGQQRIDDFLKSKAVFDVTDSPAIRFRSTHVRRTGDKTATIIGLLTARGHTSPATFEAELSKISSTQISFHVTGKVLRSPYGMDVGTPIYSNVVNFDMRLMGRRR